jgi:hypothetical protein
MEEKIYLGHCNMMEGPTSNSCRDEFAAATFSRVKLLIQLSKNDYSRGTRMMKA